MVHIDDLAKHIVGQRIVDVDTLNDAIVLDNGKTLYLFGADSCCAYSSVLLANIKFIDHVVTAIVDDYPADVNDDSYTLHVMAGLTDVLDIAVEQNNTSGYYMVDVTFTVKETK